MKINARDFFKAKWIYRCHRLRSKFGTTPTVEVLFQNMVQNGVQALGLSVPPLYPRGGAANYSLLYAILRIATELPIKRVLEIGAGQSTLLLNSIARARGLEIVTLETDSNWASRIQAAVDHKVHFVKREPAVVHGHSTENIVLPADVEGKFDLIIVDGPIGSRRRSRWTALSALDKLLNDDFVVVFDDAGRVGEQDTAKEFLTSRDEQLFVHFILGEKAQCLISTAKFREVAYF